MGTTTESSTTSDTTSTNKTVTAKTFSGVGNLIKLLPTGTIFLFQFLNPVVTNNGNCNTTNKYLSSILLIVCGFNCCFTSFTDSYTGSDGHKHYGIVTTKGLWPAPASESIDMSKYKLRFADFVHAFFAVIVFAVLGLLDSNTVRCFYRDFESTEKILLQVLPPAIGVISSSVFMMFPTDRHGIGYPSTTSDSKDSSQVSTSV